MFFFILFTKDQLRVSYDISFLKECFHFRLAKLAGKSDQKSFRRINNKEINKIIHLVRNPAVFSTNSSKWTVISAVTVVFELLKKISVLYIIYNIFHS